jgi:ribonuclease BN (tRNA processing enzyme)
MVWGPGAGKSIPVLGPARLRKILVDFAGEVGWDQAFDFQPMKQPRGRRDLGAGLRLSWQEVPHSSPTFALRLDWNGSAICFGSDCGPNDQIVDFAKGADVLILECSFGTQPMIEGVEHLNAQEVGRIAAAANPGRLLITHCYPEHDEQAVLQDIARHFAGPTEFARQDVSVGA